MLEEGRTVSVWVDGCLHVFRDSELLSPLLDLLLLSLDNASVIQDAKAAIKGSHMPVLLAT